MITSAGYSNGHISIFKPDSSPAMILHLLFIILHLFKSEPAEAAAMFKLPLLEHDII